MPYQLKFDPAAEEDLARLDADTTQRILSKLKWLEANCNLINHRPLSAEFAGLFKLRVGDYRAIYSLDSYEQVITVRLIGHRKDIYK